MVVSGQWSKIKGVFLGKCHYIFHKDFMTYESFFDAVEDYCGECFRENCKWSELQKSFKCWKKSRIHYFSCDRFLGDKESGKSKRNGKSREGSQLDFDFLSR